MKLADFPSVKRNTPLKGFSCFGIGGPADYFAEVNNADELQDLFTAARKESLPVFVIGGGSNVLWSDEGFRGLVIKIGMDSVKVDGTKLIVGAGAKWPAVLKITEDARLTGLEPFSGLPGTVGGAVAGNAGCFGLEIKDVILEVSVFNVKTFSVLSMDKNSLNFSYRSSLFKKTGDIVLSVTFLLSVFSPDSPPRISANEILRQRIFKQPPGKSLGSFFKNPFPKDPAKPTAGQLIDISGLKGFKINGAQISGKHGNFFMNTGNATCADILALRDHAKKVVYDKFGIELQEEVVIVGEWF